MSSTQEPRDLSVLYQCHRVWTQPDASLRLPDMYRVSQEFDFCYGHRLLNYAGKCRHLHGHNGKVVIVLESIALDRRGMLVDFAEIKRSICAWIDSELDHRMILCEGDPAIPSLQALGEPLKVIPHNPTAETIARLIFDRARAEGFPVLEVSLWESPRSCATFRSRTPEAEIPGRPERP